MQCLVACCCHLLPRSTCLPCSHPSLHPLAQLKQVAYLESRILAAEAAASGEVHPTGAAAQQPALFVGRVVCDSEGGRLNPQSLLLEGSQRSSNGARVRLDVSKCPGYRLFPGQVVALRGTNPSGHCIVASQVLPGHALPLPTTDLAALAGYAAATGRRGTSLVVAAGPFTSAEDLEYAPLGALLDFCSQPEHRPDVLLLLGPFVDAEHPAVRGGLLEESFEDVYASRVSGWWWWLCSGHGWLVGWLVGQWW